jgi:drug/metabolite transporter (DMT)-like permease
MALLSRPRPPRRPRRTSALARLALLAATVVWGTSFAINQRALADLPVFHFLAFRFSLATLLLLAPLLTPLLARRAGGGSAPAWSALGGPGWLRGGLMLGVLLFAEFALQTTGLLWTTPSRSAFLTSLAVVMVPPLAWLAGALSGPAGPAGAGLRPRLGPVAGALCAAAGLYVLYQPTPGVPAAAGASGAFGRGDALSLAGALAVAGHIVAIERVLKQRQRRQTDQQGVSRLATIGAATDAAAAPLGSLVTLAAVQFAVVAALAAPSLAIAPPRAAELTGFALFAIGFSGILGTAFAFFCQLYAQRHLSATEAAILLTFEPVVAALFSVAIGREPWTASLAAGGALILAAMLLSELGGGKDAVPPAIAAPSS